MTCFSVTLFTKKSTKRVFSQTFLLMYLNYIVLYSYKLILNDSFFCNSFYKKECFSVTLFTKKSLKRVRGDSKNGAALLVVGKVKADVYIWDNVFAFQIAGNRSNSKVFAVCVLAYMT